jgi:hypothetical protein
MEFILEYKNFYKEGDLILISYWYNGMITPVKITGKLGNKWIVSHNNPHSKIKNAPDEKINTYQIIGNFLGS